MESINTFTKQTGNPGLRGRQAQGVRGGGEGVASAAARRSAQNRPPAAGICQVEPTKNVGGVKTRTYRVDLEATRLK